MAKHEGHFTWNAPHAPAARISSPLRQGIAEPICTCCPMQLRAWQPRALATRPARSHALSWPVPLQPCPLSHLNAAVEQPNLQLVILQDGVHNLICLLVGQVPLAVIRCIVQGPQQQLEQHPTRQGSERRRPEWRRFLRYCPHGTVGVLNLTCNPVDGNRMEHSASQQCQTAAGLSPVVEILAGPRPERRVAAGGGRCGGTSEGEYV